MVGAAAAASQELFVLINTNTMKRLLVAAAIGSASGAPRERLGSEVRFRERARERARERPGAPPEALPAGSEPGAARERVRAALPGTRL